MPRKRNHQPRMHRQRLSVALPSFLLLGLMEHAGISKPWYQRPHMGGMTPLFAPIFSGWVQRAWAKLKGLAVR
jgi:hypothetical protein